MYLHLESPPHTIYTRVARSLAQRCWRDDCHYTTVVVINTASPTHTPGGSKPTHPHLQTIQVPKIKTHFCPKNLYFFKQRNVCIKIVNTETLTPKKPTSSSQRRNNRTCARSGGGGCGQDFWVLPSSSSSSSSSSPPPKPKNWYSGYCLSWAQ